MSERHIEVIYCDDVRHEVGNKISLMGTYTGEMFVASFPTRVPILCVFVNVVTPVQKPFEKLRVRVLQNEKLIFDSDEVPEEILKKMQEAREDSDEPTPSRFYIANLIVRLSPLQLDDECTLQVVAEHESGTISGRRLRIRARQELGQELPSEAQ